MRLGISISSDQSSPEVIHNPRQGALNIMERMHAANAAGLDSVFLGDHHNTKTPYFQNVPMMSHLLAHWQGRQAGTLHLLPLWQPVLLAEQIATMACLYPGKFVMQCGLGYGQAQFDAMGANIKYRPSAFEESIRCLRSLWQGNVVSGTSRFNFSEAQISPLPPEKIDIWIGASAPVAIKRAARIGDTWLAEPNSTLQDAAEQMAIYQSALQANNKTSPITIAIRKDVYVAATESEAFEVKQNYRNHRGFKEGALLVGTADDVSEQMLEYAEIGFTDVVVRNLMQDQTKAIASTNRLAEVREALT